MKFLIQRVKQASVTMLESNITNTIGQGLLVYVGISLQDLEEEWQEKVDKFVRRIGKLQLFSTSENKKSLGLRDIDGELLIISNFTLYGRNKKAGSIDFCHAAGYEAAKNIYDYLIQEVKIAGIPLKTGEFGAQMDVSSVNWGPVNVVIEW